MHQGGKGRKAILLIDALFLLRPSILIPCWTIFIIGHFHSGGGYGHKFFSALLGFTLLMGGVYILNQIFDRESDRINNKLFLLSLGIFPIWLAVLEVVLVWGISLYLIRGLSPSFFHFYLLAWALGLLYTTPPIKLKGRPILDLLANMVGYGTLAFLLGGLSEKGFTLDLIRWSLPYAFAVGGVFVNTTIVDIAGDRRTGDRTTAILLGSENSRYLALILIGIGLSLALINHDPIATIAIAISLPLFVLAIIKRNDRYDIISFRLPPFILSLGAGIIFPPYLLLLAVVIVSMRIYYKRRFNLVFP